MNEGIAALLIVIIVPAIAAITIAMEERRKTLIPATGTSLKLKPARGAHIVRTTMQRP